MFTDKDEDFVELQLQTTKFLGTADIAQGFVDAVQSHDSIYLPERWDTEDRAVLRYAFTDDSIEQLKKEWLREEKWKLVCFSRRQPKAVDMWFNIERGSHVKFNDFSVCVREDYFRAAVQEQDLLNFTIDIARL